MTTNKTIETNSELAAKARMLLQAGYEYWEQYRKDVGGSSAVVWLEDDGGHFILFTRGEYKEQIMRSANQETRGKEALFNPFAKVTEG